MAQRGPKIITLDIETSPIVSYTWGLFKQNVGLNQIVDDWSILSVAYKELGKPRIFYKDVSKQADLRDDSLLLAWVWQVLDGADIIVAQNGRAFDDKKIRARLIQAGYPPPSPYRIVDTLEMAKQVAKFTSNKLDWLSQKLTDTPKSHHTEFPGMELWVECLKGNKRAWKVMKAYNMQDIPSCEQVYLKLLPHYQGHPNVAAYYDDDKMRCPRCGNAHLEKQEKPYLTNTGRYTMYRCAGGGCGGFTRSRYTENSTAKRKSLLMS